MPEHADRVWIEIDPTRGTIAGSLHRGPETVQRFHGWLELVSLIEAVRGPDDPAADPGPAPESP
jgi:hypothetical protein